jgi:HD superfamily phosphohydrolase
LHDIGHGPFSHVSELVLKARNENLPAAEEEGFHERVGLAVIRRLVKQGVLSGLDLEGVENVLMPGALGLNYAGSDESAGSPTPVRDVCREIVSGPLDADKMDYLLRDSYYAGVRYGVYDLDRLARAVTLLPDRPNSYLGIKEDDVAAVDQFIIASHNMTVQVYGHRIRRIADLMLVRSVVGAIADGNDDVRALFDYKEGDAFVDRYTQVDDSELVRLVLSGPDGHGKELMRRLVERRLPKEVLEVPFSRLTDAELVQRLSGRETEKATVGELEKQLSEHLGLEACNAIFVEVQRDRPVRTLRGEASVDQAAIMVKLGSGGTRSYDQVSRFFRHGGFSDEHRLSVCVTVDEPNAARCQARKLALRKRILEAISIEEASDAEA